MDQLSIVELVKALEKSFDHCNAEYFGGLVDRPVITIAQGAKARAYGWVSVKPVWHEIEGEKQAHELNISSEYLKREFAEIVTTLMHEIVHLENIRNGVQDVARGGSRHNKKFAECADSHGMEGYKGDDYSKVGYRARLTDQTKSDLLPALDFLQKEITLCRDEAGEKRKKASKVLKYSCPVCGASCRATKELSIMCMDCDEAMILED